MLAMLATVGRVLAQHWPTLLALHLGGVLARFAFIELAGWVGAYNAVAGLLIMPIAVLARLAAFVAMFLVVRESLGQLSAIAPPPVDAAERRTAFFSSLLGAVLPFFAVYMATGNVQQDADAYAMRALEVQQGMIAETIIGGGEWDGTGTVNQVLLSPETLIALAIALAGRLAWGRWQSKLPKWVSVPALYLEGVWVFIFVLLLQSYMPAITEWVDERQAMVWVTDARAGLEAVVAPVAWLWDGLDWALAQLGGAIGEPLAWLTIAGVIYGQAVAAQAPPLPEQLRDERFAAVRTQVETARTRYRGLPGWVQAQLQQVWGSISGRVMPIWRAIVLMFRGGPVLFGLTVLLYAVIEWLGGGINWLVTRSLGPQGFYEFWMVWDTLLFLPAVIVVETLRVAMVASSYDAMIARLRSHEAAVAHESGATGVTDAAARETIAGPARDGSASAAPSASVEGSGPVEDEPRHLGPVVQELDVDGEGPGVDRHQVRDV